MSDAAKENDILIKIFLSNFVKYVPVKYGDKSVIIFARLLQGNFILLMTADTWLYTSSPLVFSYMDSLAKNSSVISKLSLIPRIKGRSFYPSDLLSRYFHPVPVNRT